MEYRPLNRNREELRLITLSPTTNGTKPVTGFPSQPDSDIGDLVHCQLEHFSLKDKELSPDGGRSETLIAQLIWDKFSQPSNPGDSTQWRYTWGDYVALSYTWGDPTDKSPIMLNGYLTAVGANLEAALRVLRLKRPMRAGCKLWIDALCIDQTNTEERSQEVTRMGKIYREACDVVIWLGDTCDESNEAMDLIQTLSDSCLASEEGLLGSALRQRPDLLGRNSWRALSQLLDRPYWDRLWVLQEIALGGDQTSILCGHRAVKWEELFRAIYTFGSYNIDVVFSLIDLQRKDAGLAPAGLKRNKLIQLEEERLVQRGRAETHFCCMLDLGRKSLVTNPRDKVYGLLGMMEASVSCLIKPNYNSTLAEVFTSFAKAMIIGNDNLEILEQCTYSSKKDMPSWVPDWTNMNHFRLFSGRPKYHATKGSTAVFEFDGSTQALFCQGIRVDVIDGLGASYYEYDQDCRPIDAIVPPRGRQNGYGSEDELKDALWRTFVGNRDLVGKEVPGYYRCLLDCSPNADRKSWKASSRGRRAFDRFISQSADFMIAGKELGERFSSAMEPEVENMRDPQGKMFRLLRTRRLMVTSSGLIGLVPNDAQQGDPIYLLFGCNVPVVLRGLENQQFKLVGGCYVHGIMEAEGMESLQAGQKCTADIIIS